MVNLNMNPIPAKKDAKPKGHLSVPRLIVYAVIVIAVLLIILTAYVGYTLKSITSSITTSNAVVAKTYLNASFVSQDLLYTNNATSFMPYTLLKYSVTNATGISDYMSILSSKPPASVYLLNSSNECLNCGNVTNFTQSLSSNLESYGIFNKTNQLHMVQPNQLQTLPNNSVLVIINGRLPDFMLNPTASGLPLIYSLFQRGIVIVYVGRDFSELISSQSVLVPSTNLPIFLATGSAPTVIGNPFTFNQSTFTLSGGQQYSSVSYEPVSNGQLIAFSNYLNTWPSPASAGGDVALAIALHFWIPVVAQGVSSFTLPNTRSYNGSIGVLLNQTILPVGPSTISLLEKGYVVTTISATNDEKDNVPVISAFKTITFPIHYSFNGSIAMPSNTFPGEPFNATMNIFVKAPNTEIEPHIDIYTKDLQYVTSLPPFFSRTVSSNFTFLPTITMPVGSGQYIAELNGFSGEHYASAYFTVPKLIINAFTANYTNGTFGFDAYAIGKPVNNVTATVALNGEYVQNVTINQGVFIYQLPPGTALPSGNLTFTVLAFHQVSVFTTSYSPTAVSINKQYIEFIIAIVIVLLEVTLVKAPNRDEFYIDISSLPRPPSTPVKLKYTEALGAFDKLNFYYKWRYMPLSKSEFRFALSNNIRINNMPLTITYNNVDLILNNLVQKGYLVSVDDLYAPIAWIDQSKHDIEYLATFKKLRVYLVGHAHQFTDLDKNDSADIFTTLHNERAYLVIYSKTSKFLNRMPIQPGVKTYLVFLNSDKLDDFRKDLYSTSSRENETLKMNISIGAVELIDADNPEGILT